MSLCTINICWIKLILNPEGYKHGASAWNGVQHKLIQKSFSLNTDIPSENANVSKLQSWVKISSCLSSFLPLSLSLSILAFFFPPSFHQQIFTEAILSDKFVWNSTLSQSNILVVPLPDVVIKWSHSSYFSTSQRLKIEPYPPFFLVSLKFREYFSLHWQRNNAVLV